MIGDNSFLPKNQNTTEKKEDAVQSIEVIHDCSEEIFQDVYAVLKKTAEEEGFDVGDEKYIKEKLENQENINIFLREGGKAIGYLCAVPHNSAYEELVEDDPLMEKNSERYYVNTIEIVSEYRKGRGFLKMMHKMFDEAEERFNINKFSFHCRTENGLSRVIQKVFKGMITEVRPIDKWKYVNDEPYEYLEGTYVKT